MKNTQTLKAGGILLSQAPLPDDILSDLVIAKTWTHPALKEPLVRLITQNMIQGIDLEMQFLGFESGEQCKVGKKRREKLGFPGWALVHDPKRAKFALEAVKEFKKALRKLKSKPGQGKEMLDEIGTSLAASVPHFLPSFYEEAAKGFLKFENYTFAAQYFEKARNAEKVYNLDVDPEMREQVFVDFALARALSVKSLTNFCKEMIAKGNAEEGYRSYFRIAVRRTRGGMPPSPTMAKDLRQLAKAANMNICKEEGIFLRDLLGSPAMKMAPLGFWKAYKKSLIILATNDLQVRSQLLDLFPKVDTKEWLAILDACDACSALYNEVEAGASQYTTADWFGLLLKQQHSSGWRNRKGSPERSFSLAEDCQKRIIEDGIPIPLPDCWGLDPDFVEKGLSLGFQFTLSKNTSFLRLSVLSEHKEKPWRCSDWVEISKHEKFKELALRCIDISTYKMEDWIELVESRPALTSLVEEWLTKAVDSASEEKTLVSNFELIRKFTNYSRQLWSIFPNLVQRICKLDIAVSLTKTLQLGVLDEYGWPHFDIALMSFPNKEEVQIAHFFPSLGLFDNHKFMVIGPEGIELEGDLPKIQGFPIEDMLYSDGELLLVFRKDWETWKAQWFGKKSIYSLNANPARRSSCFRLPDGRTLLDGYRVITPGDREFKTQYSKNRSIVSDGKNYWTGLDIYEGRKKYIRKDLINAKTLPFEKPPFLVNHEEHLEGNLAYIPNASKNSPILGKDGLFGIRWKREMGGSSRPEGEYFFENISGLTYRGKKKIEDFFLMPGNQTPLLFSSRYMGFELSTLDGETVANEYRGFRKGGFIFLSSRFLTFLEVRDDQGSLALRNVSVDLSRKLISQFNKEDEIEAIKEILPEVRNPSLQRGIAGIVSLAIEQIELLNEFKKITTNEAVKRKKDPPLLAAALSGLLGPVENHVLDEISEFSAFFVNEEDRVLPYRQQSAKSWFKAIGNLEAFAFRMLLFQASAPERIALKAFLRRFSESLFVSQRLPFPLRYFVLTGSDDKLPPGILRDYESWTESEGNDFFIFRTGYWQRFEGIEYQRSGKYSSIKPDETWLLEPGWGSEEELALLIELGDEKGPLPLSECLETFIANTGLSQPEALLVISNWEEDHFGTQKAMTLKWASDIFVYQKKTALDFFSDVMRKGDVRELWKPDVLAERLSSSWLEGLEKVPVIEEQVLASFKKLEKEENVFLLREIAAPECSWDLLNNSSREWVEATEYGFDEALPFVKALDFVLHHTPVGTDLFAGTAETWKKIRERTRDENYLFHIFDTWELGSDEIKHLTSYFHPLKGYKNVKHREGIFSQELNSYSAKFFISWPFDEESDIFKRIESYDEGGIADAKFIFSKSVDDIIERVVTTPVPSGEFEANPLFSSIDIVNEVSKTYKISENAASLFLQILSLPFPTDTSVRRWNGWKKKQHDAAIEELVKKELVVEGKRTRAGRSIFLPGFWEPNKGGKPIERWKFKHLGWADEEGEWNYYRAFRNCILFMPHTLFDRAWKRIRNNDLPGFEEPGGNY